MSTRDLDHYERRAVHDIRAWVAGDRGEDGVLGGLAGRLGSVAGRVGRPLQHTVDGVLRDPRIAGVVEAAVDRAAAGVTAFMSSATPAGDAVRAHGVAHHDDIAELHLRAVDVQLGVVRDRHRKILIGLGAVEGAATVAGAPVALAAWVASIPTMQAVSLRAVADIARHAGFDPADFVERQLVAEIALRSLELGGHGRAEVVDRVLGLGREVARRQTLDTLQQRAAIAMLREHARRAGIQLTRRRAAGVIPVVGAAAGAGMNAVHAHRLLHGASMLYRARHLARRHDLDLADLLGTEADGLGPQHSAPQP